MMQSYIEEARQSALLRFKYARGDVGILQKCFHEVYEIFFLLSGEARYMSERQSCRLSPYDIVIIPPGEYHRFFVGGDLAKYERYVLELHPAILRETLFEEALAGRVVLRVAPQGRIAQNFAAMRAYREGIPDEGQYNALMTRVAEETVLLLRYAEVRHTDTEEGMSQALSPAVRFIHAHLAENFTVEDVARACFLSPSALSHAFRECYGLSLMRYVWSKRMVLAEQLIGAGWLPRDVCRLCGYSDYSTFYRAYRRYYGHAPSVKASLEKP